MGRLQYGDLVDALRGHLDIDVFEVRFVIGAGVKSDDLHLPVFKRMSAEMQEEDLTTESTKNTKIEDTRMRRIGRKECKAHKK